MPDLPPPFPPLSRHPFAPDEERFAGAVRAARRRTRRAGAGLSAAVVVAVAVAAGGTSGDATQRLAPATAPAPAATAEPSPSPSPEGTGDPALPQVLPTALPTALPELVPSPTPTATKEPAPTASPTKGPGEHPDHHGTGSPAPTAPHWIDHTPATYAYRTGAAPADCLGDDPTPTEELNGASAVHWCAVYPGATTFAARSTGSLPFRMCRSATAAAATLYRDVDSPSWVKGVVRDDEGSVWYGANAPDPVPPAITVQPGDCVEWTYTWQAPDQPGSYTLHAVFILEMFAREGADPQRRTPEIVTTIEVAR